MDSTQLQEIANYLEVRADPTDADLLFIFGTGLAQPAHLAVQLCQFYHFSYIVVTGGYNSKHGVVEAHQHRDILLRGGIPSDRIIVEDASTNTLENVRFALAALTPSVSFDQIKSVVVIVKWFHSRRAVMTLKQHLPAGIHYYPLPYEPPGINRQTWWKSEATRMIVLKNWERLPIYRKRGHIADIEADANGFV